MDMVVNAALPRFNLSLIQAALAARVHYEDLAGDYPKIPAQLALSKGFAHAGRVGLLQAGGSPGITNVLAREAVEALDHVDTIKLRLISKTEATRIVSLWSAPVALEDMEEPPAVFRDGKVVRLPPFSEEEIFDFPPPFGAQPVVQHMHEEPLTFGHFLGKGLRYVDLKMGGQHVYQMKEAMALGLSSTKPIRLGKTRVVPRDVLCALLPPALTPGDVLRLLKRGVLKDATGCHVVRIEGAKGGSPRTLQYVSLGPSLQEVQAWMPGATNMSYRVGVGAAILVTMLARGEVAPSGVFPPECLANETRTVYLEELRKNHLEPQLVET
jgi:saccharopine dehydrogenase-like NADP-dependent oxidoreductase